MSDQATATAPLTTESAHAQARSLHEKAREHKRAAGVHRRRAQEAMKRLEALELACSELGIELILEFSAGGSVQLSHEEGREIAREALADAARTVNHSEAQGGHGDDSSESQDSTSSGA